MVPFHISWIIQKTQVYLCERVSLLPHWVFFQTRARQSHMKMNISPHNLLSALAMTKFPLMVLLKFPPVGTQHQRVDSLIHFMD